MVWMQARGTWLLLMILSAGIALASLRYLALPAELVTPPAVLHNRITYPLAFMAHVVGAVTALLLGPWQMSTSLRRRWPKAHRVAGMLYIAGVLVGGVSGVMIASTASAGPVAQWGFGLLALAWLLTTGLALLFIRQGDVARHRVMMLSSFALTFAAVTLRLYLPLAFLVPMPFEQWYTIVAWLCWVPNLVLVQGWLLLGR